MNREETIILCVMSLTMSVLAVVGAVCLALAHFWK